MTVSDDRSVIRLEIILRIFSCDPALNGNSCKRKFILSRNFNWFLMELVPVCDKDLTTDDVNSCDLFGYRMFNLYTRIYLYEINVFIFVDKKFYRSCIVVVNCFCNTQSIMI